VTIYANDPRAWLVLYNAADADSTAWAAWYREHHGIPIANMLGLVALPAGEVLSASDWTGLRDQIKTYLSTNGLDVRGIIIGYLVPGLVDTGAATLSLASMLAAIPLEDETPDLLNPLYASGVVEVADLPARSLISFGTVYLVGEINAGSLAESQALTTNAAALTTVAAGDELMSALDADEDWIILDPGGIWPALSAWIAAPTRQRMALPVVASWDGAHGYAVEFTVATSGAFSEAQAKALLVTIGGDTASSLWAGDGLIRAAVGAGYAFSLGYIGTPTEGEQVNPAAMVAALRAGGTWAEAVIVSAPALNSTWRAIGDPLYGFSFPREGFPVIRNDSGELVAVDLPGATVSIDLTGLLPAGSWTLDLSRCDKYGNTSADAQIMCEVDGDGVAHPVLRAPETIDAEPRAAGAVLLRWSIEPATLGRQTAAEYEVAEVGAPEAVLATVTATQATVSGFGHGETVRLMVRGVDGGTATPWVYAPPVVADTTGPAAPEMV
jgi:hypothetical protein